MKNLDVNSFDNGNQYASDTAEGWDSSTHMVHDPVQNAQNNNTQLALINPVAAGSQYLTDSTFMDQPGQSLKAQGHSYGTRYANQLRKKMNRKIRDLIVFVKVHLTEQ